MKKKSVFLMLTLVIISAASVNAQVLIGENAANAPHAGAILELSPVAGTNLGLLLPNVALSNNATEFALGSSVNEDQTTATGMIVYNTADVLNGPGLYVWDGSKWNAITCVPAAPERITFSTTIIELGKTITASVPEVTGATSYIWTLPGGLTVTGASSTREITIDASAAGEYPAGSIKVKAVTACGTTAEQSSTMSIIVCPTTVRDLEGNWYCTGDFGTAGTWMTQNLRYRGNLTINTDYSYPNDDETIFQSHPEYGLFYSLSASLNVCPAGWHLPTRSELESMVTEIRNDTEQRYSMVSNVGELVTKMTSMKAVTVESFGKSKPCYANGFDILLVGYSYQSRTTQYGVEGWIGTLRTDVENYYFGFIVSEWHAGYGLNNFATWESEGVLTSIRCVRDSPFD
jgi:uncharacterized protein (TIGR02145 family)